MLDPLRLTLGALMYVPTSQSKTKKDENGKCDRKEAHKLNLDYDVGAILLCKVSVAANKTVKVEPGMFGHLHTDAQTTEQSEIVTLQCFQTIALEKLDSLALTVLR